MEDRHIAIRKDYFYMLKQLNMGINLVSLSIYLFIVYKYNRYGWGIHFNDKTRYNLITLSRSVQCGLSPSKRGKINNNYIQNMCVFSVSCLIINYILTDFLSNLIFHTYLKESEKETGKIEGEEYILLNKITTAAFCLTISLTVESESVFTHYGSFFSMILSSYIVNNKIMTKFNTNNNLRLFNKYLIVITLPLIFFTFTKKYNIYKQSVATVIELIFIYNLMLNKRTLFKYDDKMKKRGVEEEKKKIN